MVVFPQAKNTTKSSLVKLSSLNEFYFFLAHTILCPLFIILAGSDFFFEQNESLQPWYKVTSQFKIIQTIEGSQYSNRNRSQALYSWTSACYFKGSYRLAGARLWLCCDVWHTVTKWMKFCFEHPSSKEYRLDTKKTWRESVRHIIFWLRV
jgi:hypothetical protein